MNREQTLKRVQLAWIALRDVLNDESKNVNITLDEFIMLAEAERELKVILNESNEKAKI